MSIVNQNRYVSLVTVVGAVSSAVSLLALWATTPVGIGPMGVTIWFVALLLALSCWFGLVAYMVGRRIQPRLASDQLAVASWRRGLFLGGYATILVALSSLRQLNLRDALLMMLLLVLVEFYLVAKA